jgi:hypothetical protein
MGARARVHAVGLVCGLAGGYALVVSGGSAIAPPVFAGCVLVAVVVTQLGRARPELVGEHQPAATASLRVRRVRDYVPGPVARAAMACTVVAIGGLATILGIARFAPRDPYQYYPSDFSGPFSESGRFQGIGIVGLLVSTCGTVGAAVLLGASVLWLVARSPRAAGDPDLVRRDERWRQEVATTVTAAVGWVAAVPVAAVSFAFAATLTGRGPWGVLPVLPALVGSVAVLLALRFASRLIEESQPQPQLSPVTGPATATAMKVEPERAPAASPQWTGVSG